MPQSDAEEPTRLLRGVEKALVIDDHPVVRSALSGVLSAAGVAAVRAEATPLAGFRHARHDRPDLAVVDVAFGANRLAGLSFVRRLRRFDPEMLIVGFSMFPSRHIGPQAIAAGADSYLEKHSSPDEIIRSISGLLERPAGASQARPDPHDPELAWMTLRHVRTLTMLATGSNYAQIASELRVSYRTVVDTCTYLKFRLGTSSLQQLVRAAVILLSIG